MAIQHCTLCKSEINANNGSAEHLILNAIGGRKKVEGFICQDCNSRSGSEWDNRLAQQLEPLCLLLGISRQRGKVPSQTFPTLGGKRIRVSPDSSMSRVMPHSEITKEGDFTRVHVEAATRKELRQHLLGLSRKYPQINKLDLDKVIASAQENRHYIADPIEITGPSGGLESGRSLVKSALALVFDAGVGPSSCDLALDYLLNEGAEPCFGYWYVSYRDFILNRPAKVPFHCVCVKADPAESTIAGYIELFGLLRVVLCLSQSYTGTEFSHSYAIDPISGKELMLSVDLDLTLSEIHEAYAYNKSEDAEYLRVVTDLFNLIEEIQFEKALAQASDYATRTAIANLGLQEGDILTDEQAWALARDVAEGMTPFILHHMMPPNFLTRFADNG